MSEHLLYIGMKHDYGDPSRGFSYDHRNFHHSLTRFTRERGWSFSSFDPMAQFNSFGLSAMTDHLRTYCKKIRPTIVFASLYHPDYDPLYEVFPQIASFTGAVTCQWFSDDHWRFEDYSQHVAPFFDLICTTANSALPKYAAAGLGDRVIKTQWGCNEGFYRPVPTEQDLDISFIGQPHSNRPQIIKELIDAGLKVGVFGQGWNQHPKIPWNQLIRTISRSKINLNLSQSSILQQEQIKGRNFEIPACGAFQISFRADDIENYFIPNKEIVLVSSNEELIDACRFYLDNDLARTQIARAGLERVLAEHTWTHRFEKIFARCIEVRNDLPNRPYCVMQNSALRLEVRLRQALDKVIEMDRAKKYFLERINYFEVALEEARNSSTK